MNVKVDCICPRCHVSLGPLYFEKGVFIGSTYCNINEIDEGDVFFCIHGHSEKSLAELLNKCKSCLYQHISEKL